MRAQGLTTQLPGARPEPTAPPAVSTSSGQPGGTDARTPLPRDPMPTADPARAQGQSFSMMWEMTFFECFRKQFVFPDRGEGKELQIFYLLMWG